MNKVLYAIVAKSGAGKDYAADKISKSFGMKKVISRTTREPRFAGEETHIFVSEDTAIEELPRSVASTVFADNTYYALPEDLEGKDIYIIDVDGMKELKESGVKFISIYIDAPLHIRIKNMFNRGDSIFSIIKRVIHDSIAFKDVNANIVLRSSQELYQFFKLLHKDGFNICLRD